MDAKMLPSSSLCLQSTSQPRKPSFLFTPPGRLRPHSLRATGPASSSNNNEDTTMDDNNINSSDGTNNKNNAANPTAAPPRSPPIRLNIKYRPRRLRKQAMQQDKQSTRTPPPKPKKDWESMTLGEKALEVYVGEKGLLFWLNKFAYASIFIIIGGWILFRFVGPTVGLYQLDTPPLAPTSIFKGSS